MVRWLVALAVIAACGPAAQPLGHPETAVALDDGGAIVVWRSTDKGKHRVLRVDATGKQVWQQPLDGMPLRVLVEKSVVVVRHAHVERYGEGDQAIAAFEIADGAPRWDTELRAYREARGAEGTPILPPYLDAVATARFLVFWAGDGKGENVFAYVVAPETGAVAASVPTNADDAGAPVVIGDVVITHSEGHAWILLADPGLEEKLATGGRGCAHRGDYVTIVGTQLVSLARGDQTKRTVLLDPAPTGRLAACGTVGDRLVLTVVDSAGTRIVVGDKVLELHDEEAFQIDEDAERHASGPLMGELPRFTPYVVNPSIDSMHLRMLDLAGPAIAWDAPPDPLASSTAMFRVGTRWYTFFDGFVTVLDGETGEPLAGAVAKEDEGIGALKPAAVGGGRVWLTGKRPAPLSAPSLAALDAATLAPVFARRIDVLDLTEETRATLR